MSKFCDLVIRQFDGTTRLSGHHGANDEATYAVFTIVPDEGEPASIRLSQDGAEHLVSALKLLLEQVARHDLEDV